MTPRDNAMVLIGREEICKFLQVKNWQTVKRFAKHYGLPVIHKNGQPTLHIANAIHFLEARSESWGNRLWEKNFSKGEVHAAV